MECKNNYSSENSGLLSQCSSIHLLNLLIIYMTITDSNSHQDIFISALVINLLTNN